MTVWMRRYFRRWLTTVILTSLMMGALPRPPALEAGAGEGEPGAGAPETTHWPAPLATGAEALGTAPFAPLQTAPAPYGTRAEVEPNHTPLTATALGPLPAVVQGDIYPNADVDYYAFTGVLGDRLYAATVTSASANNASDSELELLAADGVTVIEADSDNGALGALAGALAGVQLPANGAYYLRVRHFSPTGQLRPYRLYAAVQSGLPTAEAEPNNSPGAAQALPAAGWITGAITSAVDVDVFALALNAGDTVYATLDLDPERDGVEWNGQLALGPFDGQFLAVNDAGALGADAEALVLTAQAAGVYQVSVSGSGGAAGTYHLNLSVFAAPAEAGCTTYISTEAPRPLADLGQTASTLIVPGAPQVGDLDVSLVLTHTNLPDLDVQLLSPAGNDNGLFTDIGASTQISLNLTLDDEAAIPISVFSTLAGLRVQPEAAYRLSWMDGLNAGGAWSLVVRDDAAGGSGMLYGWRMRICDPPPPAACPAGTHRETVLATDFEIDPAGFTVSGPLAEWEWGLPAFAPVTGCASGGRCWKTDLDSTYESNSSQDLRSPAINLAGLTAPVQLSWAQRYQLETATYDHAYVLAQRVGGGGARRVWEHLAGTMTNSAGNPAVTLNASAGWAAMRADLSDFAGEAVEVLFHLDADDSVNLAGYAIDDVRVTACRAGASPVYLPLAARGGVFR